jgi:predicted  nucleic acid-binding Zn-ribbon protein
LATKGDLDGHVKDLRQEIHDARQQLDQEIQSVRRDIHEVDTKIDKLSEKFDDKLLHLEHRMTIKMGTVMTLVLTAFATAYHLLLMLTKTHG